MRFMLLLKGDPPTDPQGNATPPEKLIDAMQRYLEELAKAGVLLAAEGLQPSATGARVVYAKGERRVIDGPFTEAKELIAGFYLIQVKSKEEAIEWARRCPVDYAVQGERLAHDHRETPGDRPDPPQRAARTQAGRARPRAGDRRSGERVGLRRRTHRPHRRRPAAPGLRVMPSRAVRRGPGRADPSPARRPDHRRDREGLPRLGVDRGATDRARQTDARRSRRTVRGPRRRRARRAPVLRARGALPRAQRGVAGGASG